ncbi:MAG: hypothetical protein ACR2L4_09815 [Actinomycetota bacterium]
MDDLVDAITFGNVPQVKTGSRPSLPHLPCTRSRRLEDQRDSP